MSGAVAIVQARMGSTRLRGKVLENVEGRPLLARVIERARFIRGIELVLVATTASEADRAIAALATECGVPYFAGSEADVLDRYYRAAKSVDATAIVRLTADCPLLDPEVSSRVLARFLKGDVDYVSNTHPPTFPDGLDTEVFSFSALGRAWKEATSPSDREHVTPYVWRNPQKFSLANVSHSTDVSHHRWTVDDPQDLEFVRAVYRRVGGKFIDFQALLAILEAEPGLAALRGTAPRNAGYEDMATPKQD